MSKFLPEEKVGTITLNDKVRISDPCYGPDTWCAGTLENVLPGKYHCFSQTADEGFFGKRIASIEVRHENYLNYFSDEVTEIEVGVDSGQAGIYDLDYFIENRKNKGKDNDEWYERVCDSTYVFTVNPEYVPFKRSEFWKDEYALIQKVYDNFPDVIFRAHTLMKRLENAELTEEEKLYLKYHDMLETKDWIDNYYRDKERYMHSKQSVETISKFAAATLDDKCLVSSSGFGDGVYACLVATNENNQIVSIMIDYFYYEEDDENEYEGGEYDETDF